MKIVQLFQSSEKRLQENWFFISFLLSICLCVCISILTYPDIAPVPPDPEVEVKADGLKAVVAWDGEEELLVVSTEMSVSRASKVLRVFPLPAKPTELREMKTPVFVNLESLLEKRISLERGVGEKKDKVHNDKGHLTALNIGTEYQIGPHRITFIKAQDSKSLISKFRKYFKELGSNWIINTEIESIFESYLNEGVKFFALDLVNLTKKSQAVSPVQYRFPAENFFYPVASSSLVQGRVQMDVFVFTQNPLENQASSVLSRSRFYHYLKERETLKRTEDLAESFYKEKFELERKMRAAIFKAWQKDDISILKEFAHKAYLSDELKRILNKKDGVGQKEIRLVKRAVKNRIDMLAKYYSNAHLIYQRLHQKVNFQVNKKEVSMIEPSVAKLLESGGYLSAFHYEGPAENLRDDLKLVLKTKD
ncbi:MAG: DUF2330 domain-containing protein [Candidatus Paceibacterota bacterium]